MRRRAAPGAAAATGLAMAGVLLLGGCATQTASDDAAADRQDASAADAHNAADLAFLREMIPHHEGALTMSALAPTRASSDEVRVLAAVIAQAQAPEIARMRALAGSWGVDLDATATPSAGHDMAGRGMAGHGLAGQGMAGHTSGSMAAQMHAQTARIEPLTGPAFDRAFLSEMIEHHSGAVTMSQLELTSGRNAQALRLATSIVRDQRNDIAQMTLLLQQLSAGGQSSDSQ